MTVAGEAPRVLGRVFFFKVSMITAYFYAKENEWFSGKGLICPFEGEDVLRER